MDNGSQNLKGTEMSTCLGAQRKTPKTYLIDGVEDMILRHI
jgi:hypothetical protein